ncbi:hypothetical protein Leryth_014332 [Lithospermum erythrorhizon]|uniref:RNA-binding S4 domain-containing protein n=1 Tax=Lithospermum erythrorhizon TaxID=34254 RepID=A0AAV3PZ66_LITER|nr:hypothetical protein Leryth_014332 [Lithospermum erythrorhizon]
MVLQILKIPFSCSYSFSSKYSIIFSSKLPYMSQIYVSGVKTNGKQPFRSYASLNSVKPQPSRKKKRLDEICLERFEQYSRTYIQSWILQGKVIVDGRVIHKAGTLIPDKSVVEIRAEVPKYVCRAGHKLEAALEQLEVDVTGKVALDSGLSTGGFTDCLLQYGASHVYGVDVGYGQVADKIRKDERVSVRDRTNLRYLSELPQKVDLVTLDLSFISLLTVMPAVVNLMKEESTLVTLIKPQFEARRSQVGGGGIVRDPQVHKEVLQKIINGIQNHGFQCKGWIESPIKGAEGNKEFLASFTRTTVPNAEGSSLTEDAIDSLMRENYIEKQQMENASQAESSNQEV